MILDDEHRCFICNAEIGKLGTQLDASAVREALEAGWKPISHLNAPRVIRHTPSSARPRSSKEEWLQAIEHDTHAATWLCGPCGEEFRMGQRVREFEATYKKEASGNTASDPKYTSEALLQPVMKEDVDELDAILQEGVDDLDEPLTEDGMTALHTAVTMSNPGMIRPLLLAGANPAACTTTGENAGDLAQKRRAASLNGAEVYQLLRVVRPQLAPEDTAAFSLQQLPEAAEAGPDYSKGSPLTWIALGVTILIIIAWILIAP